jgi:AmmeMemoRadiSam system protein B
MKLPAIRGLEAFPVEADDEVLICLRDPEGYVDKQLLLTPGAYVVAILLDGRRSLSDIQSDFAGEFDGVQIDLVDIQRVVDMLDEIGFLQSKRFEQIKAESLKKFALSSIREAHLAGKSYPEDPLALREYLDGLFHRKGGPGNLPDEEGIEGKPLRGLIAPHIDLHRGGHSYGHAYLHLFRHTRPKVAMIFGVAHAAPQVPFILTRKDFATPFGTINTDKTLVDRLQRACSWDPYQHEHLHRTEHSIEFQVLMLSYLYGTDIRIVPVLCGAHSDYANPPGREVQAFLAECHAVLNDPAQDAIVICGADLAHVGKRFGDTFDIEPSIISEIESRDREDLKEAMTLGADPFYSSVMKDSNLRRVCSVMNIYAALKIIGKSEASLLHYDYAHDPFGGIVSFASVAFV